MMRKIAFAVLFALLSLTAYAGRERPEYDKTFFEPCERVVTPHIPWAKPFAGKKIRVLYITHRNAMREAVEIAQRLSMDYKVFATEQWNKLGESGIGVDRWWRRIKGNSTEELAERLRRDLRRSYDLIVIANISWDILPLDCQYEILKKVRAGAGLVGYVQMSKDSYLKRAVEEGKIEPTPEGLRSVISGLPFAFLPAFSADSSAEDFCNKRFICARLGKGRILLFKGITIPRGFQGMTPALKGDVFQVDMTEYDYYLSLVIKAMLWAARAEAPVLIASDSIVHKVERGRLPDTKIEISATARKRHGKVEVRWAILGYGLPFYCEGDFEMALGAGETRFEIQLPRLPAGRFVLNIWVGKGGRILGWGSIPIEVSSPTRIAELKLDADSFSRSKPISGAAKLEKPSSGMELRIQLYDNLGRLLSRKATKLTPAQKEVKFKLSGAGTCTVLQRIVAELFDADGLIDRRECAVPLRDFYADRDDIKFIMWDGYPENEYLSRYAARMFRMNGIDTQYTHLTRWAFVENLYHLPYAIRFIDRKTDWYQKKRTRTKENHVREPCLTDPNYRDEVRRKLLDKAKRAAMFSTDDFSLGDECHFVGGNYELCFSPTCVKRFREFLRKEYGSLDAGNKEYGTKFKSWDDIKPITYEEAWKTKRISLWVDYRRCMETVWADIYDYSRKVIREVVPSARVGYEGSDVYFNSVRAVDYEKLMKAMDINNIYFRRFVVDAVRDFAASGTLFGAGWYGGYPSNRNELYMRWFPWMALFRGANSFWVWMGHGSAGGVMAPDISLYPFFEANCEEMGEIKRGIGKLLMHLKRDDDGIAVLYSQPSVHVATMMKNAPPMQKDLAALSCLLEDLGFQFRVISPAQLQKGMLRDGKFRLLLMPQVFALSLEQAKQVVSFVRNGGAVIADLRPAVTNQHGTPHEPPLLDGMFGVSQPRGYVELATGLVKIDSLVEGISFSGELMESVYDPNLKLAGGRSAGCVDSAPAFVINKYGKGTAVLLNFSFADYYDRRKDKSMTEDYLGWHKGTRQREFARQLLRRLNIFPAVHIEPEPPRCLITKFHSGGALFVGIVQELPRDPNAYSLKKAKPPRGREVTIQFPRVAHIYDVRAGDYIGRGAAVRGKLRPARAKLFALLPYRVEGLSVKATEQVQRGGTFKLEGEIKADGKPALHVVRVEFYRPDGREAAHYSRNLLARDGKFSGEWRLALNEDLSVWRVEVRDVVTGAKVSRVFRISR